MNILEAIGVVTCNQVHSSASWDAAVDSAECEGNNDKANMAFADSEVCADSYEKAIQMLVAGDPDGAVAALEEARGLEAKWGDSKHADESIAAIKGIEFTVEEPAKTLRNVSPAAGRRKIAESLEFVTPPINKGQMFECSYAMDPENCEIYCRTIDRNDGSVEYSVTQLDNLDGEFEPWNEIPGFLNEDAFDPVE